MVKYLTHVYVPQPEDTPEIVNTLANVVPFVATQVILAQINEVIEPFLFARDADDEREYNPEIFVMLLSVFEEAEPVLMGFFERIFQLLMDRFTQETFRALYSEPEGRLALDRMTQLCDENEYANNVLQRCLNFGVTAFAKEHLE